MRLTEVARGVYACYILVDETWRYFGTFTVEQQRMTNGIPDPTDRLTRDTDGLSPDDRYMS
jgi:hypothetical protein